jgi:hypothetical protein
VSTVASENKQQTAQPKSVANNKAGAGIAAPAVPVLQQKETEESEHEHITQKKEARQFASKNDNSEASGIVQPKHNNTGMPDNLKSGVENLSGMDMSDVKVHYNSSHPAQLNAHAYAQGNDIHLGPGQEQHLAHEAWHVVQQRQGRVQATRQMKGGVPVNDDPGLEHEADVMGAKALQMYSASSRLKPYTTASNVAQLMPIQFENEGGESSGGIVWGFISGTMSVVSNAVSGTANAVWNVSERLGLNSILSSAYATFLTGAKISLEYAIELVKKGAVSVADMIANGSATVFDLVKNRVISAKETVENRLASAVDLIREKGIVVAAELAAEWVRDKAVDAAEVVANRIVTVSQLIAYDVIVPTALATKWVAEKLVDATVMISHLIAKGVKITAGLAINWIKTGLLSAAEMVENGFIKAVELINNKVKVPATVAIGWVKDNLVDAATAVQKGAVTAIELIQTEGVVITTKLAIKWVRENAALAAEAVAKRTITAVELIYNKVLVPMDVALDWVKNKLVEAAFAVKKGALKAIDIIKTEGIEVAAELAIEWVKEKAVDAKELITNSSIKAVDLIKAGVVSAAEMAKQGLLTVAEKVSLGIDMVKDYIGAKVDEYTPGIGWDIVKGILKKELEAIQNSGLHGLIGSVLKAGDEFVIHQATNLGTTAIAATIGAAFAAVIGPVLAVLAALKTALTLWDKLSDNIKTGLLYVLGFITAKLPRTAYLQDLIVKGGKGEIRASIQAWIGDAEGWVTTVKNFISAPVTNSYEAITGDHSFDPPQDPKADKSGGEEKKEKGAGGMININHPVLTLQVNNLVLGYENEKNSPTTDKKPQKENPDKGKPGMIVDFFIQLHLLEHNIPEREGDAKDRLFVPFSGVITYTAGAPIVLNQNNKTASGVTIGRTTIFPLKVEGGNVTRAKLNVNTFKIGEYIILNKTSAELDEDKVTIETDAKLNLAGFVASGNVKLVLHKKGEFNSLEIKDGRSEGDFVLNYLKIAAGYNGAVEVTKDKFDLFNGALTATGINVKGEMVDKKVSNFTSKLENLELNSFGSKAKFVNPSIEYTGEHKDADNKDVKSNFVAKADEISANLPGISINLKNPKADKNKKEISIEDGTITINGYEIKVHKAFADANGVSIEKATLIISEYGIEGEVNHFEWNKDGIDFDNIKIGLPGKTIKPIDQVELSKISVTISNDGGLKLILTSDIIISPNNKEPLVGVEGAELTLSKQGIEGKVGKIVVNTSMFSVDVENAEINKERLGAKEASISFKKEGKKEDPEKHGISSNFDGGLLDHLNLDGLKLTAHDIYFIKGSGFSVGNITTNVPAFEITVGGVKVKVDPEKRLISFEGAKKVPGEIPGVWPFGLEVGIPIFIGVNGNFGIKLDGGVELALSGSAQKEKGINKPFKFEVKPAVTGIILVEITAGVGLGNKLLVELQGNIYAQAKAQAKGEAKLAGEIMFTDENHNFNFINNNNSMKLDYLLSSEITAEVGGKLSVKAFLFYEKELKKVKFKEWKLGHWEKKGEINWLNDGKDPILKGGDEGKFAKLPIGPDMDEEIIEGEKVKELLLDANTRIIGGGAKREDTIRNLTKEIALQADSLLQKSFDKNALPNQIKKRDDELRRILTIMNNVEKELNSERLENGAGDASSKINTKSVSIKKVENEDVIVSAFAIVSTKEKFIELSESNSRIGGARGNVIPIDNALGEIDALREKSINTPVSKDELKGALVVVTNKINEYRGNFFGWLKSGRKDAILRLEKQIEFAMKDLE